MTAHAGRVLLAGGAVLSMDPAVGDLEQGDVLVEDGAIVAVAPHLEVSDCDQIDATGMVVMPGLVEAHRHLWYAAIRGTGMDATVSDMKAVHWPRLAAHYTPEDLYVATRSGAVDALEHGITTVLDWCHVINSPDHGAEAVRALGELPIRAIFAYGASMARKLGEFAGRAEHGDSWEPARRLRRDVLSSDRARQTMALAIQGPEFTSIEKTAADLAVARELDLPVTMHCGTPAGAPPRRAIRALSDAGLLHARMQFVHCCTTSDEELVQLADVGATAVACPIAELAMAMGEPAVGRMRDAGLPVAAGADAVAVSSGDLFDEARAAILSERGIARRRVVAQGRPVRRCEDLGFTAREALEAITIGAARACHIDDRVGSLTPGKRADVVMLRATELNLSPVSDVVGMVVSSAHGLNVDTVLVDGQIVRRGGRFVDQNIDVGQIQRALAACRDRLRAAGGFKPTSGD